MPGWLKKLSMQEKKSVPRIHTLTHVLQTPSLCRTIHKESGLKVILSDEHTLVHFVCSLQRKDPDSSAPHLLLEDLGSCSRQADTHPAPRTELSGNPHRDASAKHTSQCKLTMGHGSTTLRAPPARSPLLLFHCSPHLP